MEDTLSIKPLAPRKRKDLEPIAKQLGIGLNDADTLVSDIIPMLKRKFKLLSGKSKSSQSGTENNLASILDEELPKVFTNYALTKLRNKKAVLIYIVKNISPDITDLRAKQLVDVQVYQSAKMLAEELATQLGIRTTHIHEFRSQILPKLKKHTKNMYKKKLQGNDPRNDIAGFKQFVIDNVFIDEFENHPFIRTATDKSNRAILL
ncbi:MAG: hypothetical protein ACYS0I_21360, partial [Planctomycetota bacterium]